MAQCVTKVELHISCRSLLDKDAMSKSDPLAAVLTQDKSGKWFEVKQACMLKSHSVLLIKLPHNVCNYKASFDFIDTA